MHIEFKQFNNSGKHVLYSNKLSNEVKNLPRFFYVIYMKTCICTIIKNEHQYLDEWIQYHLNLGIDHIYIYEDIDSKSHKRICDKYTNVELNSIYKILDDTDIKVVNDLKTTKKSNPQYIYIRRGLSYIQSLQVYDWCFVIDNDEFITLENTNTCLKDVIQLYNSYDAFIMQWKCYGASGLINKPNYSKNGVVNTYAEEIKGFVPAATPQSLSKTCYNLKTYRDEFFLYTHQPSKYCNFCRTNFERNRDKPVYDKIYIRHYITKSWEEYVWKLKERGFLFGKIRTNNFFFDVNSELKIRQKELMEVLKDDVLVILPYKQGGSQGNELEIALSLWRKYCTFNYHFVVIGEFDKSLKEKFPWVEFIYSKTLNKINAQYTQHLDVIKCINTIYEKYKDKYSGFIWMVDDNYAIKPFALFDILQTYYHSNSFIGDKNAPTNFWRHDKWKTRQLLDKENLPHINYTTHFPCWFDFEKLLVIIEKYDLMNESYVLEDIYFNYYEHEKPIKDDAIRLGIWNYDIYKNGFQKALDDPNIKFMCNSVEGWSQDLENDLKRLL